MIRFNAILPSDVRHYDGLQQKFVWTRCFSVDPREGLWKHDESIVYEHHPLDYVPGDEEEITPLFRLNHSITSSSATHEIDCLADICALHQLGSIYALDDVDQGQVPPIHTQFGTDHEGFVQITHVSTFEKELPTRPKKSTLRSANTVDFHAEVQIRNTRTVIKDDETIIETEEISLAAADFYAMTPNIRFHLSEPTSKGADRD